MAAGLKAPDGTPVEERLGNYVLRRYLAQGGMAVLYLGHHIGGREVVVAKRILPQFSRDSSFTQMFTREASLASLLRHPNIVAVHESGGLETAACYFIMEYIHGIDLNRFLARLHKDKRSLPLTHALSIALAMCEGLHYAHEMVGSDGRPLEIVHRDISPANVMLGYDGQVKVMDFGVAKALALTSFTEAGTRKGKLSYMAPEQATVEALDRRADVFAIGAVLYELTTMQRLLTGKNELAVIHQLMYEARTTPSSVVPGYPEKLEEIVLRAVAQDPNRRFATAADLAKALRSFAGRSGLRLSVDNLGAFVREQSPPPPHPADDPSFFEEETPRAATAVEIGVLDTAVDALAEGGGLPTHAAGLAATSRYPTMAAPHAAVMLPSASGQIPVESKSGSGTRVGLVAAALATLAASGGMAFFLTRADPGASSPSEEARPAVAPAAAPAQGSDSPAAVAQPPSSGVVVTPPVAAPAVVAVEPVVTPPPVAAPVAEPAKPRTKKKRKKKQPVAEPPPVAEPTPPPVTKKKKKRSPTDTLLPG